MIPVKLVRPTKVVDDVGNRLPSLRMPLIMRKLVIFCSGTVFVFTLSSLFEQNIPFRSMFTNALKQ